MNKPNNVLIALILGCTVADNMHITQALSSLGVPLPPPAQGGGGGAQQVGERSRAREIRYHEDLGESRELTEI